MGHSTGFPPIGGRGATVLILGSLPSRKSLDVTEYYAHPQNAFWRIMGKLFGAGLDIPYARRTVLLNRNNIALWDVLASSCRPGSMDSDIDLSTAKPNDFSSFLNTHCKIRLVCFNGKKAAWMFEHMVLSEQIKLPSDLRYETLPSTSPAFAAMSFEEKLRKWSIVLPGSAS